MKKFIDWLATVWSDLILPWLRKKFHQHHYHIRWARETNQMYYRCTYCAKRTQRPIKPLWAPHKKMGFHIHRFRKFLIGKQYHAICRKCDRYTRWPIKPFWMRIR